MGSREARGLSATGAAEISRILGGDAAVILPRLKALVSAHQISAHQDGQAVQRATTKPEIQRLIKAFEVLLSEIDGLSRDAQARLRQWTTLGDLFNEFGGNGRLRGNAWVRLMVVQSSATTSLRECQALVRVRRGRPPLADRGALVRDVGILFRLSTIPVVLHRVGRFTKVVRCVIHDVHPPVPRELLRVIKPIADDVNKLRPQQLRDYVSHLARETSPLSSFWSGILSTIDPRQ